MPAAKKAPTKTTAKKSVKTKVPANKPETPKRIPVQKPKAIQCKHIMDIGKEFEHLLETYHKGVGSGLRNKFLSSTIPQALHGALAMINAMRNKAAHKSDFVPSKHLPENFFEIVAEVRHYLKTGQLLRAE